MTTGGDRAVRIGAAAAALGVSTDTLRRWERAGLARFERRGSTRYMPEQELSRLLGRRQAANGAAVPNRLRGEVTAVRYDGATAHVELACGPYRIVSVLPRAVADALALAPGDAATAAVSAVSVTLDRA